MTSYYGPWLMTITLTRANEWENRVMIIDK